MFEWIISNNIKININLNKKKNSCISCPDNANYDNGLCKCKDGLIAHLNSCIASCPDNYFADATNTYCIKSKCDNCLSCDVNK